MKARVLHRRLGWIAALVAILAAGGARAEAPPFLLSALKDDAEMKLQAHNALVFLAGAPAHPLAGVFSAAPTAGDDVANALSGVTYPAARCAESKVLLALTRSALRALHALKAALPAKVWAASPVLGVYLARVEADADLRALYAAVGEGA
jgi:hypothetical protein